MRTPCAWGSFWDNCRDKCPTNLLEIFPWVSARIVHDGYRMVQMQGINGTNTPRAFSRMICGAALIPILIPTLRLPSPTFILSLIPKKKPKQDGHPSRHLSRNDPHNHDPKDGAHLFFFSCVFYRFRVGRPDLRNLWKPLKQ